MQVSSTKGYLKPVPYSYSILAHKHKDAGWRNRATSKDHVPPIRNQGPEEQKRIF